MSAAHGRGWRESDSGVIGGGQVRCDFQATNLVFGVERQFDFGEVNGSRGIAALPDFTESKQPEAALFDHGQHRLSLDTAIPRLCQSLRGVSQ
jgi:hypothetical protein